MEGGRVPTELTLAHLKVDVVCWEKNAADPKVVEYVVEVVNPSSGYSHRVAHRYNEFHALQGSLTSKFSKLGFPAFPPKSFSPNLADRRTMFSAYVKFIQATTALHNDFDVVKFFQLQKVVEAALVVAPKPVAEVIPTPEAIMPAPQEALVHE
eukprot:TRINITY_DN2293_c0_g4_i2.p2 TRINITY_DN2293_c0_g4~~TRINITY_DN2293_c0_g4_i2.p2  ORF type:complete len:153 (+),score=35.24 TRINITY_DN2293_c0_g4_i2:160-618(+)